METTCVLTTDLTLSLFHSRKAEFSTCVSYMAIRFHTTFQATLLAPCKRHSYKEPTPHRACPTEIPQTQCTLKTHLNPELSPSSFSAGLLLSAPAHNMHTSLSQNKNIVQKDWILLSGIFELEKKNHTCKLFLIPVTRPLGHQSIPAK